ncbi:hypothetical protein LTR43_010451 [Exophiala xenobiotica]|nr:hypothetical protein LTR14_006786 [Exophiala xenobiotica]
MSVYHQPVYQQTTPGLLRIHPEIVTSTATEQPEDNMDAPHWNTSRLSVLGRITEAERSLLFDMLDVGCSETHCVHGDGASKWHSSPRLLAQVQGRLTDGDLEYLVERKAFSLPCYHIRDKLFASFLLYVYPYVPCLDVQKFHNNHFDENEQTSAQEVSPLLLQAVFLAGMVYADESIPEQLGFSSRLQACRQFYENAKLLYAMEIEDDDCSRVAALLLMTYAPVRPSVTITSRYWVQQAVSLAFASGLHLDPGSSHPQSALRRRLWWSCYIKERLTEFPKSDRYRIRDYDHDVKALTLADLQVDLAGITTLDTYTLPEIDATFQRFNQAFIHLVGLVKILGRITESTTPFGDLYQLQQVPWPDHYNLTKPTTSKRLKAEQLELDGWHFGHSEAANIDIDKLDQDADLSSPQFLPCVFLQIVYEVCLAIVSTKESASKLKRKARTKGFPSRRLGHVDLESSILRLLPPEAINLSRTRKSLRSTEVEECRITNTTSSCGLQEINVSGWM